jgi:hypothetical protein
MTVPHDEGTTPSRDDPVTTPPPRPAPVGLAIGRMLSGLMLLLGAFVLLRLLIRPGDPLTPSVALDIAFGLFFVGRGALYFWTVRRRMRG